VRSNALKPREQRIARCSRTRGDFRREDLGRMLEKMRGAEL
jgi:hypothetical protein